MRHGHGVSVFVCPTQRNACASDLTTLCDQDWSNTWHSHEGRQVPGVSNFIRGLRISLGADRVGMVEYKRMHH